MSPGDATDCGQNLAPARWLHDAALAGAINMARDEALLECRVEPTLRFYRWAKPTLSYGYFQPADSLPWQDFVKQGCEVVRRATGGKAILHDRELTYSLCLPETGVLAGGPARSMRAIHSALAKCLALEAAGPISIRDEQELLSDQSGSAWCFEDSSPLDLVMHRRKLVGSAARRRAGWVLFHGSIVIEAPKETPEVAELSAEPELESIRSALGNALGFCFSSGDWTQSELEAAELAEIRHRSDSWLNRP